MTSIVTETFDAKEGSGFNTSVRKYFLCKFQLLAIESTCMDEKFSVQAHSSLKPYAAEISAMLHTGVTSLKQHI